MLKTGNLDYLKNLLCFAPDYSLSFLQKAGVGSPGVSAGFRFN
jgi:hypothetical protein